ncbi:sensor histidine kinase, putative [Thermodesulfovibrio yellowstonii DSM 11347]|uniref:Sensor histidine kinase, putative n=1 Tax=Thermodesulfovibrio yellowstonii (strain ATCC 51303 / DSM 11347 / YP87) TaxID=289376 RepID=B5YFL6_THEYD|nr:sensor histidine kinase, putative [Thermodesulfovibrio yellowstonii DSM 11347]
MIKGYTWKLINSQRRIKELYSELNSFIQLIPDGIVIISQDFKILWMNTVVEKLLDKKIHEGINMHCYEIFYKKNVICEVCPVKKAFENVCLVEETITYLSGSIFNIRAVPIFDEYHKVSKVMVLIRDVTKQKKNRGTINSSAEDRSSSFVSQWNCS